VRIARPSARRQGDIERRNFLPAGRAVFNRLPDGAKATERERERAPEKKKARR
jgi:hypothetical protein